MIAAMIVSFVSMAVSIASYIHSRRMEDRVDALTSRIKAIENAGKESGRWGTLIRR